MSTSPELNSEPTSEPTITIGIDIPVSVAVALKHKTNGQLDVAEAASMIVQLYSDAPLDRGARFLTTEQFGRICQALGKSPQSMDDLVSAIESTVTFSLAGVKVKWTAEEIGILTARNSSDLPPAEWAKVVFDQMKEAWINGRI